MICSAGVDLEALDSTAACGHEQRRRVDGGPLREGKETGAKPASRSTFGRKTEGSTAPLAEPYEFAEAPGRRVSDLDELAADRQTGSGRWPGVVAERGDDDHQVEGALTVGGLDLEIVEHVQEPVAVHAIAAQGG